MNCKNCNDYMCGGQGTDFENPNCTGLNAEAHTIDINDNKSNNKVLEIYNIVPQIENIVLQLGKVVLEMTRLCENIEQSLINNGIEM